MRWLLAIVLLLVASPARADDTADARDLFRRGAELAKDSRWSAALSTFEKSAKLRASAGTTYNIGICQRALGQYVLARRTFARALEQRTSDADLPDSTVAEIAKLKTEIDSLVATIDVTVEPSDARLAIDGQPLESVGKEADLPLVLAGTLPAGPGKPLPAATFRMTIDPGHHVFVLSREGFADAVHADDVRAAEKRTLKLALDRLPATLNVASDKSGAVVMVDELDVGVAPITLMRPAGKHRVVVRKPGYLPYETDATVSPGQKTDLLANLREEKPSILTRWWFWTAAAVVVTGAAITTYAVTRPSPERPALDGGGLGWTVRAP